MATGISIHVGVNATKAPGISVQPLVGCENDAEEMRKLARARGFVPVDNDPDVPIIREKANFKNVLGKIRIAAEKLQAGDIFLFTFSGHGTRRGAEDPTETDLKDETLVLHDKLLVDNVLRRLLWPTFKQDVRVVMVSDSCHSGGVAMSLPGDDESEFEAVSSVVRSTVDWARSEVRSGVTRAASVVRQAGGKPQNGFRERTIPESQTTQHFDLLKAFYKTLRESLPAQAPAVNADFLLLAACEEFETTKDGLPNGVFTRALLDVFDNNGTKTYAELKTAITLKLQPANGANNGEEVMTSHPVLRSIGDELPDFANKEAFKI